MIPLGLAAPAANYVDRVLTSSISDRSLAGGLVGFLCRRIRYQIKVYLVFDRLNKSHPALQPGSALQKHLVSRASVADTVVFASMRRTTTQLRP
jgi:hypothetical protein